MVWKLYILSVFLKMLLMGPGYMSTDYDVHTTWLNVTTTQPMDQWYKTIDYPPFFAHFEYVLGTIYKALGYPNLVLYQKATVIASDVTLALGLQMLKSDFQTQVMVLFHPALLILDHVHFQYNGFLIGILLMSIALLKNSPRMGALLFTCLMNFKHLYASLLPAVFVHLIKWANLKRFFELAVISLGVCLISLAPFDLKQVFNQLFPFERGLVHTYWAPNVWAWYVTLDRIIMKFYDQSEISNEIKMSFTKGLGLTNFFILPSVSPMVCVCLSLGYMLLKWNNNFESNLLACAEGSFLFGFHVHEKAIMTQEILKIISHKEVSTATLSIMFPLLPVHPMLLILLWCYSTFFKLVKQRTNVFFYVLELCRVHDGFIPLALYSLFLFNK